jgi:predicted RNA binding protein with dsRBD fold (UPF0201 family)
VEAEIRPTEDQTKVEAAVKKKLDRKVEAIKKWLTMPDIKDKIDWAMNAQEVGIKVEELKKLVGVQDNASVHV